MSAIRRARGQLGQVEAAQAVREVDRAASAGSAHGRGRVGLGGQRLEQQRQPVDLVVGQPVADAGQLARFP